MIDAVFISDLHLSPHQPEITRKFHEFLNWVEHQVKAVYILGDFFHAWAGDDLMDDWCKEIAKLTKSLREKGILFYYIHGNRDFLLGESYARLAGWEILSDPTCLEFSEKKVLITHGDQFCTLDKKHQRFRRLTRNDIFKKIFLLLPKGWRKKLVNKARELSQAGPVENPEIMDVVEVDLIDEMRRYQADILIHGHTHRPGHDIYQQTSEKLERYVLSDWDDKPWFLCYDKTNSFYFIRDFAL